MGIFDFLKKIVKINDAEEIISEKLAFSEIEDWIGNKIKENESKEKEIVAGVKEKIENLVKELEEKNITLKSFDVGIRKEKEEIKNIVIGSREKYVESVEDLIEKLNNLEESKLEKMIEKINKTFFDFNKSSSKNYERTTILIGKEMASIKESLKVFSTNLLKIFDESKSVIDFFKELLVIKEKLNKINLTNKTLAGISENKLNLNKKIIEKEEEDRILKQSLEAIKASSTYLESLEEQKKMGLLREELKKNVLELKQLLDFKLLANFFHINPEQMKMVQNHRDDFHTNFMRDNGQTIINLLEEAKLNNDLILERVNKVRAKIKEIENHKQNIMKRYMP